MTQHARQVLDDCRLALSMLEEEKDLARWRVHWAGAVALIRAVGNVLEKADGKDAAIRRESNKAYTRWKSSADERHEIFREFILRERNFILKEYQFNLHPLEEVHVVIQTKLIRISDGKPEEVAGVFPIGDNIYRPLMDSCREGDDARDVYSEAIEWWKSELTVIDNAVAKSKQQVPTPPT